MTTHMENENENINNGVYNKERGYGGKPSKGEKAISFSEDGEFAIFACGYKQKLGNIQAEGVKTGWVKPYDVIYNSVY